MYADVTTFLFMLIFRVVFSSYFSIFLTVNYFQIRNFLLVLLIIENEEELVKSP